jgi:hypothetical protein
MEALKDFLTVMNSYPTWAKALLLLCLAVIAAVLVFAKPVPPSPPVPPIPRPDQQVYLRISSIALYPSESTAEIRIISSVNGTEYTFPSEGGAKWMRVGPDMNRKIIPIPTAAKYVVAFRMEFRDGRKAVGEPVEVFDAPQTASGSTAPVAPAVPYGAQFKLYQVQSNSTSPSVAGVVSYEMNYIGHW